MALSHWLHNCIAQSVGIYSVRWVKKGCPKLNPYPDLKKYQFWQVYIHVQIDLVKAFAPGFWLFSE